ncbi:methylase family protein [Cystoisospora suis]|uniref:Methylase family protein n=1 Tax=Cystoisospora suis TaxID=483139 RepID=A0A2C6L024_9APIC|nr:methylase family protein [Cystoisospora suis]
MEKPVPSTPSSLFSPFAVSVLLSTSPYPFLHPTIPGEADEKNSSVFPAPHRRSGFILTAERGESFVFPSSSPGSAEVLSALEAIMYVHRRSLNVKNCVTSLIFQLVFSSERIFSNHYIYKRRWLLTASTLISSATLLVFTLEAVGLCTRTQGGTYLLASRFLIWSRSCCMQRYLHREDRTKRCWKRCLSFQLSNCHLERRKIVSGLRWDSIISPLAFCWNVSSPRQRGGFSSQQTDARSFSVLLHAPESRRIQADVSPRRKTGSSRVSYAQQRNSGDRLVYGERLFFRQGLLSGVLTRERHERQENRSRLFGRLRRLVERHDRRHHHNLQERCEEQFPVFLFSRDQQPILAGKASLHPTRSPSSLVSFSYSKDEQNRFFSSLASTHACSGKRPAWKLDGERKTSHDGALQSDESSTLTKGEERGSDMRNLNGRRKCKDGLRLVEDDEVRSDYLGAKILEGRRGETTARCMLTRGEEQQRRVKTPVEGEKERERSSACSSSDSSLLPSSRRYHEHIPVMKDKTTNLLITKPNGFYVDCTAGGGGHSSAIWRAIAPFGGRLLSIDVDGEAVEATRARMMHLSLSEPCCQRSFPTSLAIEKEGEKRTGTEASTHELHSREDKKPHSVKTDKEQLHSHKQRAGKGGVLWENKEDNGYCFLRGLKQEGNTKGSEGIKPLNGGDCHGDSAVEPICSPGKRLTGSLSQQSSSDIKQDGSHEDLENKKVKIDSSWADTATTLDKSEVSNMKRHYYCPSRQPSFAVLQVSFADLPTAVGRAMKLWSVSSGEAVSESFDSGNLRGTVDGMLADLGVSTHQLSAPYRGFSYSLTCPLDMRFAAEASRQTCETTTAALELLPLTSNEASVCLDDAVEKSSVGLRCKQDNQEQLINPQSKGRRPESAGSLLTTGLALHGAEEQRGGCTGDAKEESSGLTAAEVVNQLPRESLEAIFRELGEEPLARRLAEAIVRHRESQGPLQTTGELRELVEACCRYRNPQFLVKTCSRVFQALRIYVNQEFEAIDRLISHAEMLLKPGGRLAILSYHSLEDRLIKQRLFFRGSGQTTQMGATGRSGSYFPGTSAVMRSRGRRSKSFDDSGDCHRKAYARGIHPVGEEWDDGINSRILDSLGSSVGADFPLSCQVRGRPRLSFLSGQHQHDGTSRKLWKAVNKKPLQADEEEVQSNRSRRHYKENNDRPSVDSVNALLWHYPSFAGNTAVGDRLTGTAEEQRGRQKCGRESAERKRVCFLVASTNEDERKCINGKDEETRF